MISVATEVTSGDPQVISVNEALDRQQLLQENRELRCGKNFYLFLGTQGRYDLQLS